MRTPKEIYQAILDNWDEPQYRHCFGICARINCAAKDLSEIRVTNRHFEANRPTFLKHVLYFNPYYYFTSSFWWPTSKRGDKTRKRFLKHLIKKLP